MYDIPEGATHKSVRFGEYYKIAENGDLVFWYTPQSEWKSCIWGHAQELNDSAAFIKLESTNPINPNQELLDFAVRNIKEWGDGFTHLRSDSGKYPLHLLQGVFYTKGDYWISSQYGNWGGYSGDSKSGLGDIGADIQGSFKTSTPQVITKQEWEKAVKEATTPKSEWFGKKVKVNPETSALVQQAVFDAGGFWESNGRVVSNAGYPYLYTGSEGKLVLGISPKIFEDEALPEIRVEIVKSIKIVETIQSETVEEKNYKEALVKLAEAQEAVEKLKPKGK